jgi:hypothetical protein
MPGVMTAMPPVKVWRSSSLSARIRTVLGSMSILRWVSGRLHASGKGLMPYIKGDLYLDLIAANLNGEDLPASPDPTPQEIPGSWDDIGPGHVVNSSAPNRM